MARARRDRSHWENLPTEVCAARRALCRAEADAIVEFSFAIVQRRIPLSRTLAHCRCRECSLLYACAVRDAV